MRYFKIIREITTTECPWLDRNLKIGEIVALYMGHTYECVSNNGIAVNIKGIEGFVEIPLDAIEIRLQ